MSKLLDVALVFQDLKDALNELKVQKSSPKLTRQAFSRFLTLSQQLTEIMRKEYKRLSGREWSAKNFNKWNVVTDLFKKLRREDYHEYPLLIHVKERQYFPINALFEDDKSSKLLVFEGTWSLGDPFSIEPPDGIQLCIVDTSTGRPLDKTIEPAKREYEFVLFPRTEEMRQSIEQTGSNNIHLLSEKCFETLLEYVEYYKSELPDKKREEKGTQSLVDLDC